MEETDTDPDGVWVQTGGVGEVVFLAGAGPTLTGTATGRNVVRTKSGLSSTGAAGHKVDGNQEVDTTAPSFSRASVTGTRLTVTFSEAPVMRPGAGQ